MGFQVVNHHHLARDRGLEGERSKRDKEFLAAQKLTEGMDDVYVNGDSYIPGARAIGRLFKGRRFAPVEA